MNPEDQWGVIEMNVRWNHGTGSYTFDCIFGCFEADFESEREACEAFLSHSCISVSEPCS